jgi:hypothetical protein
MNKATNFLWVLLCSQCVLFSQSVFAQDCRDNIISSNNAQQFAIHQQKGTVIDTRTGLEWAACGYGQTWIASAELISGYCQGLPTHFDTFEDALAEVETAIINIPAWQGFRIPNIKELGSLVERSCIQPAIDLSIFSGTLNAIYYSSTPDNQVNSHFQPSLTVRVIDFTEGSEFIPDVNQHRYLRLVKVVQ